MLGIWAWGFVGFVVALTIVVLAVGAESQIVLPLTFAAVLAVCFRPMARPRSVVDSSGPPQRRGLKRSAAAILDIHPSAAS